MAPTGVRAGSKHTPPIHTEFNAGAWRGLERRGVLVKGADGEILFRHLKGT